jgi:hypothetical protein
MQQKCKANENISRHNPNKKQKQTLDKKSGKDPMQRGFMNTK